MAIPRSREWRKKNENCGNNNGNEILLIAMTLLVQLDENLHLILYYSWR
jgi:hypothetical protein